MVFLQGLQRPTQREWLQTAPTEPVELSLRRLLATFLAADEDFLWTGQPDAAWAQENACKSLWMHWLTILGGVAFWVAIFVAASARWQDIVSDPFDNVMNYWTLALPGVVLLGIGTAGLISSSREKLYNRYTLYAVTNLRTLKFAATTLPSPRSRVQHWSLTTMWTPAIDRIEKRSIPGRSDIVDVIFKAIDDDHGQDSFTITESFQGVPLADNVAEILRQSRPNNR